MSTSAFLNTFTKFFPVPKVLSFDFVGIDLCKDSIKVMRLKDSKFGKVPKMYKEYELDGTCGLMELEPQYKNCEQVLETLKLIKKEFNVNYVNVSIPEIRTYVYKTKIPSGVGDKISETILFSLEENVPIKPDEVLLDFFVIDVDEDSVEAVVTAVSKDIIDMYTKLFEDAGLEPISFEPETHAITRGIISKGDSSQYVLLNLDSCMSSIVIIENEVVQYTQTVSTTSRDFSEGFNEEEAKSLKEQINKIIIYWETTLSDSFKKGDKLKTLYLVGDLLQTNELVNYLEKNMNINIKIANVWTNCFSLDDFIPSLSAKDSLKYSTAVGLSLKRIK
jgi:Tfp pilus assembly PilM family ATPase